MYLKISDDLAMAIGNFLVHIEFASISLVRKVLPNRQEELEKKEMGKRLKVIKDELEGGSIILKEKERKLFEYLEKNNKEIRIPLVHGIYQEGAFWHTYKREIRKTGRELKEEGFDFSEDDDTQYVTKRGAVGFSASYLNGKTQDLSDLLEEIT